jgi:hypothetical protein
MYIIKEDSKIKLEECFNLLNGMNVVGYQNIIIASNIFTRLQSILQDLEKTKDGIIIDNTKEVKNVT